MAHVFQGFAAFGTDKGLNAAAEGNPAHNVVASSRVRRGHALTAFQIEEGESDR
jgi:hypothetical protein